MKSEQHADGQHPRAKLALGLLMIVAVFSYIDRNIVAVLQEGIRLELGLSDTQLGVLTGLAFAVFYTLFAIPVARIADSWKRKYVIAIALAMWSLMTAGSGLAAGFITLLLFRIGVAIGEAGSVPTSHSLISDYFPRNKRATALSIWGLTLSIGPMTGFLLGGWLHDLVGWRNTFLIIGLTGAALAPLVLLLLPEPKRGATDAPGAVEKAAYKPPPFRDVATILWKLKSFRFICIGTALHAFSAIAMASWNAPFYQRLHDLSATEVGIYLGIIIGVPGALGTLFGGLLADRLGQRDIRWYMAIPGLAAVLIVPFAFIQYLAGNLYLSLGAAVFVSLLTSVYLAPVNATSQSLVSAGMRATTSATLVFVTNIIGLGMGPFVTGIISDVFSVQFGFGSDALRYAILCTLLVNVFSAWAYLAAARRLPTDGAGKLGRNPDHSEQSPAGETQ